MNMISKMSLLRLKVDALFDHATAQLNAEKIVMRNAALAGDAAVLDFTLGLAANRSNLGIAIIRCAEKPVDDRLKLRG